MVWLPALVLVVSFGVAAAWASAPESNRILNYQMRLANSGGQLVADGTYDIKVTLYDAATSGSALYSICTGNGQPDGSPTAAQVSFTSGVASILVGGTQSCVSGSVPTVPADLFNENEVWLGVTVETDSEMTPRKRIVAAGYAMNSDRLDDLDSSEFGGTSAFVPVTDQYGNLTLTGTPQGSGVTQGSLTVNPGTATANQMLFGVGLGGSARFTVDEDGDAYVSGWLGVGTATPSTALHVEGAMFNSAGVEFNRSGDATVGDFSVSGAYAPTMYFGRLSPTSGDNTTFKFRGRTGMEKLSIDLGASGDIEASFETGGGGSFEVQRVNVANTVLATLFSVSESNGYVGVGTSAGRDMLDVYGGARFGDLTHTSDNQYDINLFGDGTNAQSGAFNSTLNIFGGDGETRHMSLYQMDGGEAYIDATYDGLNIRATGNNGDIQFTTENATNAVTINVDGEVDIAGGVLGTTSATFDIGTSVTTMHLAGGSTQTGCTIDGTTGNLTCSGTVTGSGAGYATRELDNLQNVAINTHLLPDANLTWDLGTDTLRWRDAYVGAGSLHIGDSSSAEATLSYSSGLHVDVGSGATISLTAPGTGGAVNLNSRLITVDGRLQFGPHGGFKGLRLPQTTGGAPTQQDGTDEGDVVWDPDGDALYIYNGSTFDKFTDDTNHANSTLSNLGTTAINSALLPDSDNDTSLGSNAARWGDVFIGQSASALHIGDSTTEEATLAYDAAAHRLNFDTGTDADIAFFTDDLYLDKSSGNVGFGDTDPVATLTVGSGDLFQVAGATGNVTTAGDIAVNGGDLTTSASAFNIAAGASTVNIAGGDGSTGCSIVSTGQMRCSTSYLSESGTGASGINHFILGNSSQQSRFAFGLTGTESGSNTGSDIGLWYYNDAGSYLGTAYTVTRSTGDIDFKHNASVNGDLEVKGGDITTTAATFNLAASASTVNIAGGASSTGCTVNSTGEMTCAGLVYTTAGGIAGEGTATLASTSYVQSRGMNLVTNGSGLLNSNYNFTSFTFDQSDTHGGKGSFLNDTDNAVVQSDELIPVDGDKTYEMSLWAKSTTYVAGNHAYFGVVPYDVEGLSVLPYYYMRLPNTDTTLAVELKPGDSTITLTDASNWDNASAGTYRRQILIFDYTNSYGYTYPAYTYSRNNSRGYGSYNTNGAWAIGGISGNTITLTESWPADAGTIAAGTAVSNGNSGSTYKYLAAVNQVIPNTWTNYSGTIGGWDTDGSNDLDTFPYGTASVKLLFLMNRDVTGNETNVSDLWFSEMTAANLALTEASATEAGIVSLSAQQLGDGEKYFGDNVGIGTTSVDSRLHIEDTVDPASAPVTLTIENATTANWDQGETAAGIDFAMEGDVNSYIRTMHTRTGTGHAYNDAGLVFGTGSATSPPTLEDHMVITHDGLIGVGTTAVSDWGVLTLDDDLIFAAQDTDYLISTTANGGAIQIRGDADATNRYLQLGLIDNSQVFTPRLTVADSGYVGVGTVAPSALFSVGSGNSFTVDNSGNVTTAGSIDTSVATLNVGASASTLNLAGGSGSTGCTIDGSGNLTCTGTVSGSGSLGGSGAQYATAVWTAGTTLGQVGPGSAGQLFLSQGAGAYPQYVTMSGAATISDTGTVTVAADSHSHTSSTISGLDASSDFSSGTLPVARGGTGASSLNDLITLTTHTTGDYVASVSTNNGLTGTGSGEGSTPTIGLDYSATLAGNPAMSAGYAQFASTGVIFEGSSADIYEGLLTVTNPTADRTWTLPNASGTIAVSASGNIALSAAGDISFTGTLPVGSGGTGITSYAVGDILYASGAAALSRLAAVATGNVLISGGVATAPSWGKVALGTHTTGTYDTTPDTIADDGTITLTTEVAGILPVANGGTGANSLSNLITLTTHTTGSYVASTATNNGLTGGAAGSEGATLTLGLDYTATLGGNPAMAAGHAQFATTGVIFEGSSADIYEGLLTVTNPTADRTWTLPNASGTIAVSASGNIALSAAGDISFTGTLPVGSGGTGITSYAVGDILYASGAAALSRLAAVATGNVLISGGVATAPSWGKVALGTHTTGTYDTTPDTIADDGTITLTTEVAGILPVANGGTGVTTLANNGVLYGDGANAVDVTAAGTEAQFLVANASGVPTFVSMSGDVTITAAGAATVANDSHTHSTYATTTLNNLGTTAINADLLPSGSRNLGSNAARWTSLYTGVSGLHIGTAAADEATLAYDSATDVLSFDVGSAGGGFAFNTDDLFVDKGTGYIGVGTTAPTEALEVDGKVKIGDNTVSGENVTFDGDTSAGMRVTNDVGYVSITPLNAAWAHIYTDRPRFIFNEPVYTIDGRFNSYNTTDLVLTAGNSEVDADLTIDNTTGDVTLVADLYVNGGAVDTTASTFDVGSSATTLNLGAGSTTLNLAGG
ncbi:hypothetical protein ACFL26_00285, partial [Patescibacteria group bacterium]